MSLLTLDAYERLYHSSTVTIGADRATAHLTSNKIFIAFYNGSVPPVTLPLTNLVGAKTSVLTATNPRVMMMLQYTIQPVAGVRRQQVGCQAARTNFQRQ